MDSAKVNTKETWKHLDRLLGNGVRSSHQLSNFSAEQYHQHMDDKISAIQDRASNAGPAGHSVHTGSSLTVFCAPTVAEIMVMVRSSPNKQCQTDPVPIMWLLKDSIDLLAPLLMSLLAKSLMNGKFTSSWMHAIVCPHLKQACVDEVDVSNHRPVSNLPFLSKVLE